MNDAYAEWLVKRKTPAINHVLKVAIIVVLVFSILLAMMNLAGIILMTVVGIAAYFVIPQLNLEFEYLVVNDQITIDKVMGRSKRKKAWEGNLEQIQVIAPVDAYQVKDYDRVQGLKVLDFTSHQPGARVYGIIHQDGSSTTKVLFEPNDKILNVLRQKGPRKVLL